MLFFTRINVFSLIREHFATLYDNRLDDKKINLSEVLLLLLFALAIPSFLIFILHQPLELDRTDCFLTVFSIAVGFLSSTLFVLADRKTSVREANSVAKLKECFYNTAFSLIVSLTVIFCYIVMMIAMRALNSFGKMEYAAVVLNSGSFIIYAMIVLLFHSLLMVIRRVFLIFDD